jgi:hypothetical protein
MARQVVDMACEIFHDETGKRSKYPQLITLLKHHKIWMHSTANKFGWLAQGARGRIEDTNTIYFIYKHQAPINQLGGISCAIFFVTLMLFLQAAPFAYPNQLSTCSNVLSVIRNEFISAGRNFKCTLAYLNPTGTHKILDQKIFDNDNHHQSLIINRHWHHAVFAQLP